MTSIFLVEDHSIFAQSLRHILREKGHLDVIAVAGSAEEALEQIQGLPIDLVLVDVSLPQRSGISLVFDLHKKYPHLPCVMLSGQLCTHFPGGGRARLACQRSRRRDSRRDSARTGRGNLYKRGTTEFMMKTFTNMLVINV